MCLAARNFSRRHSRSRHSGPCRLHFATRYYLKRPTFCLHLRVLALYPPNRWDPLPLCLCLSQGTLVSYFCLSLNQHLPPANTAESSTSSFEWKELTPSPPNEPASIVFGCDSLVLTTKHAILAEFLYSTSNTTEPLTSTRYTLLPAAGSHFFARSSHSQFLSGIEYLHSQDCIADSNLSAEAWRVDARRWDGRKTSQFLEGPLGSWGG